MKRVKRVLFFIFFFFSFINVYALSLETNEIYIEKSSSKDVKLYVNTDKEIKAVGFSLVFSSYDYPVQFVALDEYKEETPDAMTHELYFNENKTGKIELGVIRCESVSSPKKKSGTVNINNAVAQLSNGKIININSQELVIKLADKETIEKKEEEQKPKYNLLSGIESSIVKINITDNVYEYKILVPDDIEELDLKPVPINETYKVEIGSQKISDIKDNKLIIKVTSDKNEIQEYVINIEKVETNKIKVDKTEFKADNSYKGKFVLGIVLGIIMLVFGTLIFKKKK